MSWGLWNRDKPAGSHLVRAQWMWVRPWRGRSSASSRVSTWRDARGAKGSPILDAPPGTSCPVVETMRGADFVLLVTEPTPFGLHDLRLAVQVARGELGLPVGVVVNRDGIGDTGVDENCASEGMPILMRIPLDRRIAEAISEGKALVEVMPEY